MSNTQTGTIIVSLSSGFHSSAYFASINFFFSFHSCYTIIKKTSTNIPKNIVREYNFKKQNIVMINLIRFKFK